MRTLNLIKGLTDKETEQVSAELKTNKRSTLYVLLKELIKYKDTEEEPENAHLYKKVFKQAYKKDKDYLLRNELRLLNEQLYNFYVRATFNSHATEHSTAYNFWLARAFYSRRLKNILNQNLDEFIEESLEFMPPQLTTFPIYSSAMMGMKSLWMIETYPKNLESLQQQIDYTYKWEHEATRRFFYVLAEINARKAYLQMTLARIENKFTALPDYFGNDDMDQINFKDLLDSDWYARYIKLKIKLYQTKGEKRIEIIKEMMSYEEKEEVQKVVGSNSLVSNLGNLGLEYISLKQYGEAAVYFEKALQMADSIKTPTILAHIQNYIITLVLKGNYERALDVYGKYQDTIKGTRSATTIPIFTSYALIFLNRPDEALESFPKISQLIVQHQSLVRFGIVICYIQRNQFDIALNELQNIKRTLKKFTDRDYSWQIEIADLFITYTKAHNAAESVIKERKKQLAESIKLEFDKYYRWAHEEIELWWLMKQLGLLKQ
jgi:tetratricopeptide (TPR) repeat protein